VEADQQPAASAPAPFWVRYPDLLQPRLGAEVEWASDEFFAPRHRLIQPEPPVWRAGVYDEHGKWMDGWETRRRRGGGHDSCIVRLGLRGVVRGVDIDTTHFDGNQPVAAMIEAWDGAGSPPADAPWRPLVPETPLGPSRQHRMAVDGAPPSTHLRLHIYPDGGVARLRAYGEVVCDWSRRDPGALWDLAAVESGGQAIAASDQHFGSMHNLNLPGRGRDMGDGWETRRRRGPGNDWVILRLGHPGSIDRVEVDTAHFKGNYPHRCSLRAALLEGGGRTSERVERAAGGVNLGEAGVTDLATIETALGPASETWPLLLGERPLQADSLHTWSDELAELRTVSHVRLDIYPDGGVSRLRLWGRIDAGSAG
jgi:allantoicase